MGEVDVGAWTPRAYLDQYYATPEVPDDSRAILGFVHDSLGNSHYERALEFGCGPALYTAFTIAPHVGRLDFSDLRAENLAEIDAWRTGRPEAFDWALYATYAVGLEGADTTMSAAVSSRMDLLRRKMGNLFVADIRDVITFGGKGCYDLVTSFFCIECADFNVNAWNSYFARLANMVRPGGRLVLASLLGCDSYAVFDSHIPVTHLNEGDLWNALENSVLDVASAAVCTVEVGDWKDQGFNQICLLRADRPNPDAR
ncbi:MAG: hypothetical protein K1X67_05010 [Fimbriimonadaceae bacterium]|nr:hypothetical protein [Fimbriimonadaceae bacterium]